MCIWFLSTFHEFVQLRWNSLLWRCCAIHRFFRFKKKWTNLKFRNLLGSGFDNSVQEQGSDHIRSDNAVLVVRHHLWCTRASIYSELLHLQGSWSGFGEIGPLYILVRSCWTQSVLLLFCGYTIKRIHRGILILILTWFFGCFQKKSCPEYTASFLNQLTFEWFTGLAILGNKKSLEREDLWDLNERDKAENLIPSFMENLKPEVETYRKKIKYNPEAATQKNWPSILIPIFKTYKFTLFAGGCYKLIFDLMQFIAPELLRQLISFIEDKNQPMWIGISIALLMFISSLIQSMILHQYFHEMFRLGMNIRSVLTSAVYSKTLNLSNEAKKGKTTGAIVNLMSVDIQRIQDMTTFIMLFWSAPLQVQNLTILQYETLIFFRFFFRFSSSGSSSVFRF